jgi:pSer/pThr/pTyr-binding forkhead associated (FHA) protein
MDDFKDSCETQGHVLQGPHWHRTQSPSDTRPATPLRLILQPSCVVIELTEPDTLVGRHTNSDIRLPLPDVSRNHCRFVYEEGLWQVVDLNSLNGVHVNDVAVARAILHHRDQVRIGSFVFAVELPEVLQATTADDQPVSQSEEVLRSIAEALPLVAESTQTIQRQAS